MRLEDFRRRHRTRTVRAGGQRWGVIEARGRRGAPVLVMLPGTLGTAEIFWNQIAALEGRVHVVSLTYPAVGDILRLADGLAVLFDKLGIARASIVGSSLGGYLGQWFAARHPARVETAAHTQVVVPDDPSGDGAVGTPSLGQRLQLVEGRSLRQPEQLHRAGHEGLVAVGPHVWPEQAHREEHVGEHLIARPALHDPAARGEHAPAQRQRGARARTAAPACPETSCCTRARTGCIQRWIAADPC